MHTSQKNSQSSSFIFNREPIKELSTAQEDKKKGEAATSKIVGSESRELAYQRAVAIELEKALRGPDARILDRDGLSGPGGIMAPK